MEAPQYVTLTVCGLTQESHRLLLIVSATQIFQRCTREHPPSETGSPKTLEFNKHVYLSTKNLSLSQIKERYFF